MNARPRRRLIHRFNYLHTDFARLPAYDAATVAATRMSEEDFQTQLQREQQEADGRWAGA